MCNPLRCNLVKSRSDSAARIRRIDSYGNVVVRIYKHYNAVHICDAERAGNTGYDKICFDTSSPALP